MKALPLLLIFFFSLNQSNNSIQVKLSIKKAFNGKIVKIEADQFYSLNDRRLISVYTYPENFIAFTNENGEIKVYYPNDNKVLVMQNNFYSSLSDVLYFFLTQNANDIGLSSSGYTLIKNEKKDGLLVTKWTDSNQNSTYPEAELVYEDYKPIYLAYKNGKGSIINKTYYGNYQLIKGKYIPCKITEISYTSTGDSIVSRKEYSDFKFDENVRKDYFNYKIPDDAKLIK